jgi:Protein of unknown function (DUF664)
MAFLQYQRESLARKAIGLDDAAARQSSVRSGTTLLWLVRHLAYAERRWIIHRFAGGEKPPPHPAPSADLGEGPWFAGTAARAGRPARVVGGDIRQKGSAGQDLARENLQGRALAGADARLDG